MKKYKLSELEEIARSITQQELAKYIIPEEIRNNIALATLFEDDDRVLFCMYREKKGITRLKLQEIG